jgi:DNA-binding MurR/RpiR family transcriptional regulator
MAQEPALFALLKERSARLSRNHRALARHLLEHYQSAAFCTVKQLAQQSRISEATIVRFARALGFKGYPALQQEIRRIVRADLKGTERFQLTPEAAGAGRGSLAPVVDKELENIAGLCETFDRKAFGQAVAALAGASEILIAGSRSAAPLAQHLWFGLDKLDFRASRFLSITSEAYDRLHRLDRRALVVVIGFPRYLRELVAFLEAAARAGRRTLAVTDSPFSPLRGDMNLYSPAQSASFVAFHCAPLVLVNALLHELSTRDRKRTLAALNRFEALAERLGYFHAS